MKAGRLDKVVTLQRQVTTRTATGQKTDSWTDLTTRRASIMPMMGKEFWADSGEHSKAPVQIRLRYDSTTSTLTPADRIAHGSDLYDINTIQNPRERGRELVLMCQVWQGR